MKMITMVLPPDQADDVVQLLLERGQRVTRLASTGGFLRQGRTSLIVGAEEQAVPGILEVVQQRAPGTVVLVLPLERYERY
jgi:uncharacterized protein YaaQ